MLRWGIVWGALAGCAGTLTQGQACDRVAAALCLAEDACTGGDDADACYDQWMRACCAGGCDRPAAGTEDAVDGCVADIAAAGCDGAGIPASCDAVVPP
jgi:hypothetical protein